jgi:hypothetical protein
MSKKFPLIYFIIKFIDLCIILILKTRNKSVSSANSHFTKWSIFINHPIFGPIHFWCWQHCWITKKQTRICFLVVVKMFLFAILSFCYVMTLSVSRLYSISDRMINEYGVVGWMRIGRGDWSTRRKPAPVPFCVPQIPHDLAWDWTQATVVRSWRLTAWAVAQPVFTIMCSLAVGPIQSTVLWILGLKEWSI